MYKPYLPGEDGWTHFDGTCTDNIIYLFHTKRVTWSYCCEIHRIVR